MIEILELEKEIPLASIPLNMPWERRRELGIIRFSPDGNYLIYPDVIENQVVIYRYDANTKQSDQLFTLPHNVWLSEMEWAPSQNWLSYSYYFPGAGTGRIHVYNISTGENRFISSGYYSTWFPDEDLLMYQNAGGGEFIVDVETNSEVAAPQGNFQFSNLPIQSHDANFYNMGYRYLPRFDAFLLDGSTRDDGMYYYHLIDRETRSETAFLAHFQGFEAGEIYIPFRHIMQIPNSDDYMVYVNYIDRSSTTYSPNYYALWKRQGPSIVFSNENRNGLKNVVPMTFSPDGTSFIGLDFGTQEPSSRYSLVIADLETARIVYRYAFELNDYIDVPNYDTVLGVDVFWPQDESFARSSYASPTPALAPNQTPAATTEPRLPLAILQNLQLTKSIDLSASFNRWQRDNARVLDSGNLLLTPKESGGVLAYPVEEIDPGEGILVRFRFARFTSLLVGLTSGEWGQDSLRFWGVIGGSSGMSPHAMKGTSVFNNALLNLTGDPVVIPDQWYYLFLGRTEDNRMVQIFWAENNPRESRLGWVGFQDPQRAPSFTFFVVDTGFRSGEFELSLMDIFEFSDVSFDGQ